MTAMPHPFICTAQGYVNVTETLNLPGYGTVFVAGDITSSAVTLNPKTAMPAKAQARVVDSRGWGAVHSQGVGRIRRPYVCTGYGSFFHHLLLA